MRRIAALACSLLVARSVVAQPAEETKREEAVAHFNRGMAYFRQQEWTSALGEFIKSRELYPSRAATKNAAYCFRKESRYAEALDMYEAFLRDFHDLEPDERDVAEEAVRELAPHVGAIDVRDAEPGATVVIDGRERGVLPFARAVRADTGQHIVFVYKSGFAPVQTRVNVEAGRTTPVAAHLGALIQSGRLRVTEASGRTMDVLVDNVVVGKSPWEGTLAAGSHVVALRGEGNLGAQPSEAPVRTNQLTPLTLVAEELEGALRVDPTPSSAVVALDGVTLGRGVWDGRVRAGGHRVEVAQEGFLPFAREIAVDKGQRQVVSALLDRDLSSPLWAAAHPPRVVFELDAAAALAALYGGDLDGDCTGGCSRALPFGFWGALRGAYQLRSGISLGVDAGYLLVHTSLNERATQLTPKGLAPNPGSAGDSLTLHGITLGVHVAYHTWGDWPVTLRLGLGALVGSVGDERTGTFTNSQQQTYPVAVSESDPTDYLYVAPELRLSRRLGAHLELGVGVSTFFLAVLKQASWKNATPVAAGPAGTQGDGQATFGGQTLAGGFLIVVVPGVSARYEL